MHALPDAERRYRVTIRDSIGYDISILAAVPS